MTGLPTQTPGVTAIRVSPALLPRAGLLLPQAPHDQQGLRGPGNSRCLTVGTAQETGEAGGQRGQQGCGNREGMPHEPGSAVAPGLGD